MGVTLKGFISSCCQRVLLPDRHGHTKPTSSVVIEWAVGSAALCGLW